MSKTVKNLRSMLQKTGAKFSQLLKNGYENYDKEMPIGEQVVDREESAIKFTRILTSEIGHKLRGVNYSRLDFWKACLDERIDPFEFLNDRTNSAKKTDFLLFDSGLEQSIGDDLIADWESVFLRYLNAEFPYRNDAVFKKNVGNEPHIFLNEYDSMSREARLMSVLILDGKGFSQFLLKSDLVRSSLISSLLDHPDSMHREFRKNFLQMIMESACQMFVFGNEVHYSREITSDDNLAKLREYLAIWVEKVSFMPFIEGLAEKEKYIEEDSSGCVEGRSQLLEAMAKICYPDVDERYEALRPLLRSDAYFFRYFVFEAMADSPEHVVSAMREIDNVREAMGHFAAFFKGTLAVCETTDQAHEHVMFYRKLLLDSGYPDIKGRVLLAPLASTLEKAELFHKMGFLPDSKYDVYDYFGCKEPLEGRDLSEVADRFIDVSLKLGLECRLLNMVDGYFKGYPKKVDPMLVQVVVKRAVEREIFNNSKLVNSNKRIENLAEIGVSMNFLSHMKGFKKTKVNILKNDLDL